MSFGAEIVAKVLGLPELPSRRIRQAMGAGMLVAAIAFPVTFRHGIELYAQREARQITQRLIDPLLQQLARSTPPAVGGKNTRQPHPSPGH
jgi:hypothetical protein